MIVVFGVTLLSRGNTWNNSNIGLHLFSSYRKAWNDSTTTEWRNIILNILLFIPLGFLLPLWSNAFRIFWKTYLSGFLLTSLIEGIQLLSKRGIFELDDIFNNALGTIIGYGFLMIVLAIINRKNKEIKYSVRKIITMQMPLLIAIIGFTSIFIVYQRQEFGNLRENCNFKLNMSKVQCSLNTELSDQEKVEEVYYLKIGNLSEALDFANRFFAKLNTSVDETQNNLYESTAIFRSLDGNYSLWVDYAGFTTAFTDFHKTNVKEKAGIVTGKTGCDFLTIKNELSVYGISIPETSDFSEKGNGSYTITVKMYLQEDGITNGILTCELDSGGELSSVRNNIISYKKYAECNNISEQEAYKQIKEGKFLYNNASGPIKELKVESVNLSYRIDSKGYFQTVYEFSTLLNGDHTTIVIQSRK